MAAALFRSGTGLCVRCIHRELCRLVWRPQTALFSFKPSDRQQSRRTHIKKAKPQPAVDIVKLLEQLFSQRRPGTVPPVGKARPAKASSMPPKPPTTSSESAVSAFPATSGFKQADYVPKKTTPTFESLQPSASPANPKTSPERPQQSPPELSQVFAAGSASSETLPPTSTTPASLESEAAAIESQTSAETIETKVESAPVLTSSARMLENNIKTSPFSTAAVEPLIETSTEPSVEPSSSALETVETRAAEGSVETSVETEEVTAVQAIQTNSTDSGVVDVSYSAKEEPSIETAIEPEAVSEGTIELKIETEAADNLLHAALIQNTQESEPLSLKGKVESTTEFTAESSSGNDAVEETANRSEQMTLESVTLHDVQVMIESLEADELLQTKSILDVKAEKLLQALLVQTATEAEHKAADETENSSKDESEIFTEVLSKWDSLCEDLQELEGESDTLVKELLCHVPAAEAVAQESITLAKVLTDTGGTETDVLETRNAAEKEAEAFIKEEKTEVKTTTEDVDVFEDTTEVDIITQDSRDVSEATYATDIILEAMFSSRQGLREPTDTLPVGQEAEKESREQEGTILEAMNFESVTLAEVEASLGTLDKESLSEITYYLDTRADILSSEKRMEVEDGVASEESTEALQMGFLSLPVGGDLSDDLLTDPLMAVLLFSVPWHVTGVTEGHIGQEVIRTNTLDASAAATDDCLASLAVTEVLLGQEVEQDGAQTEASGNEDGTGTHADLDPVKKLFLEKIREYNNMRRLNGGLLEAEPDCEKYLSEETAKLQRHFGGGDLCSFPQFTFTEPKMDP